MEEGKAESIKHEDSEEFSAENSCPPLVIVSSRIKSHALLASCVNPGVEVVKYQYESTTLQKLFQMVETTMKGRKALCIAIIVHGQVGCLKLCSQKVVSTVTIREDTELKDFFTNVATKFLNADSLFARVDFLASTVAQGEEGVTLLEQIRVLMKIKVCASGDILGEPEAGEQGASPVRIGALYFDVEKLKDWNAQSQATMANYEKIKVVGKGAYGAAVLYRKKDDDSQVILKEINLLNLTKEERSSALNEVQVLKVLDHPHIISYYDNFEEEGVLMIEMEYADGGTLAQFLKQQVKQLSEEEILRLFSQMVEAIQYLHDHHILHRDLKTANVFLTKDNNVKVGDFGISKILSETNQEAHTVLGTPYYISPEICEGKKYNAKSDMWSLGCILYEMTCLQKTFDSTNLPALVHKIVQAQFPPVKGDFSEELKKLIQDLLQKDPEKRPSANEVCTVRLPPLVQRYHTSSTQEMVEEGDTEEEVDPKNTKTTSLLLYLDGRTLLFNKIELPIKSRAAHVAVGFAHVLVVTQEGMAYSWGEGGRGQLGHGDTVSRSEPQLVEALRGKSITRCECGGEFSVFLSDNGLIMSVGRGDMGATGHGEFKDCLKPRLIEALLSDDITDVSCGESHAVAVTSDGHVYVWGAGGQGRLGTGTEENKCTPTKVAVQIPNMKTDEVVRTVKCGMDGTMYLTNSGRLFASGSNKDNKLGLNQRETFIVQMKKLVNKTQLQVLQMLEPTPVKELGKHRVIDMALGPTHSAVLVETGSVYTFGRNSEGQLCSGNTQPSYIPVMVKSLLSKAWMVTCSELSCIVLTEDMKVNIWGSRPILKTPLTDLLCPTHKTTSESQLTTTEPQVEGQAAPSEETPQLPPSPNLPTSPVETNAPVTPALERKTSAAEILVGGGSQVTSPTGGIGGVAKSKSGELQVKRHGSIFFLSDAPHTMFLCNNASKYSTMLTDLLSESLEASKNKAGGPTPGNRPPQTAAKGVRRGPSMGSSLDMGRSEGVILRPTPVDLLEISGSLFTSANKTGQRLVRLEDIACFGSNLLVLLEVQEREGGVRKASNVQSQLLLGTKLNKKISGSKNRIASPPHNPPPPPPPPPPPATKKEPAPQNESTTKSDVSLIPLPGETKPGKSDSGTKAANTTSVSRSSSEDSYIPPWLKREVEEALAGKQPVKLPGTKEGAQAFQSPNNVQSLNSVPEPPPVIQSNPLPLPQPTPANHQFSPQAAAPGTQTPQAPLPQTTPLSPSNQPTNPQQLNAKLPLVQPPSSQPHNLSKQPSLFQLHPKVPDSQPIKGIAAPGTPPTKRVWTSSKDISNLDSNVTKTEPQVPTAGGGGAQQDASMAVQNQPALKEQHREPQVGSTNSQPVTSGSPKQQRNQGTGQSRTLKEKNSSSSLNSAKGVEAPRGVNSEAQSAVQPGISHLKESNLNTSADSGEELEETPSKTSMKQKTTPPHSQNPKVPGRGGNTRAPSTSCPNPVTSSHIRSRSELVKAPKTIGAKKSQSAGQIVDKMAERVKSPLAPTLEESSDGDQPASPQNSEGSFADEKTVPDTSGHKNTSPRKQSDHSRPSTTDHSKRTKPASNAHMTGHSVEVTTTSPYEVSANLHPRKPLPQSKRNRTQTAPSKALHKQSAHDPAVEEHEVEETGPTQEIANVVPDNSNEDLLKGEVERLKTVVEEQNRMLLEGQQVVMELKKKMSEMELQKQSGQNGSAVANDAAQSDPQPISQKRSLFKFKNQNKEKRVNSAVCAVM